MKFKAGTRRPPIEYEKTLVKHWKKNKTFEKSVSLRSASNAYVFYDGPPFITGIPHHGTLLTSVVKDVVPRYQTMKGRRVERVWGWDCHGLPAEVFTEQKLGIKDKRDIGTKISLEEYITTCRDNMVQTGSEWEDTIDRIGRWVDFKGAYRTMDKDYMESVWWAFKELYEAGKIYEGEKVLLYCIRDATPISKAEVAMDNSYQDVTDPSVYAKFKLADKNISLLVWTTVPWTLLANTALAVDQAATYIEVEVDSERFIVANKLVDKVFIDEKHHPIPHKVIRKFKGKELVGQRYEPFYKDWGKGAHFIHHADFVSLEEGSGVVSQAPAYGEEDYELSQKNNFPVVSIIDDNGVLTESDWKGKQVWEADKDIAKTLLAQGKVYKIDYYKHSYPHCHRCGTKLIYRAHPSWFMDIDGQRAQMLEQNGQINWFPEHIKNGRSAKTIQSAPDWNLSRDRFWATAMPIWKGVDKSGKEHIKVVGSYQELKELSGVELEDYHRPWIDEVTFELDGVKYRRIEKVLDCWFESGSMPFAQFHYPFENEKKFEENFPGDFIVEYVPQVRAWFYYMQAVSVGLFGKKAFKTALVHGTIAGSDGRKMSKSFGNYTDPNELMDKYSADALRFLFLTSPLLAGDDYALIDKDVADTSRKLSMIWNMYDFFTMYADVDGWEFGSPAGGGQLEDPSDKLHNLLDVWIVSRIHQLIQEVEKHMEVYDLPNAVRPILPFIDDASNWYVRRSRRRFWKSGNDSDKNDAYRTLHYVLVQLAHVIAPFAPFLAEELYTKLTNGESVHLRDWPEVGHVNETLVSDMQKARDYISEGLALRAAKGVKVRQPLSSATIPELPTTYRDIIMEELNVKTVKWGRELQLDMVLTDDLKLEGISRELIRHIQNARKQADLKVDDRIMLSLKTYSSILDKVVVKFSTEIKHETLATKLVNDQTYSYQTKLSVEDEKIEISLERTTA